MLNNDEMKLFYFQVTDIWKRLCEEHGNLFDLTCDEYSFLIESKLDELDQTVAYKNISIETIADLEVLRQDVIKKLNTRSDKNIESVSDLLLFFSKFELEVKQKHLFRFNSLLIDIIEKIQHQNKENQIFLKKAIDSLRSIRESAVGEKSFSTYTNRGSSKRSQAIIAD